MELATPVLAASGTFGSGRELAGMVDLGQVGAIVTKSVTPRPVKGMPTPRMAETPSGMLNAIGLQNPGVEAFVEKDGPFIERAGVPVIVSIAGRSVQEFAEVAVLVSKIPGVVGIEANISCPNVERRGEVFARDAVAAADVISTVTRMTHLPVLAKLTADVTDIVDVAQAVVRAGAHGLSLINTLLGMAIDPWTGKPRIHNGYGGLSGPAIRPVAVRNVHQVHQAFPEVPIIGMGGIRRVEDVIEFIRAGATAVAIGTAGFAEPFLGRDLIDELRRWLADRGVHKVTELRGLVEPW
jgi:dihydroorotate dehydrogenase (NAD+) catalytic subunit